MADIEELETELIGLVKEMPSFKDSGFSVFDLEDFQAVTAHQTFPLAGVAYDGALPQDKSKNAASPVSAGASGVAVVTLQFTIIIALQYHYGGQDDTKPQAKGLLKDVRQKVLGYRGVNTRPWRFIGERPEPSASGAGLVFYSQVWQTEIPVVGTFNNS